MNENKTLLTVIDIQGKLAQIMHDSAGLIDRTSRLIRGIQALNIPILWLEQLPDKLGPTPPELAEHLSRTSAPIAKIPFSAYMCGQYRTALEASRRDRILLCGIETHICVFQTAKDLIARGYEVTLVADAVSSRTEENRRSGIEAIRDLGADVSSVESVLFELLKTPEHPAFRAISKIVK